MTDFSHLTKLSVDSKNTADFPLYDLEGTPVLQLTHAGQSNKGYYNALLKTAASATKRGVKANALNSSILDENRAEDKKLYPKFIVVGWTGITDSQGKDVPFDQERCTEFLKCLPDYIFDEIRAFAGNPRNFTDMEIDSESVGKN